MRSPVNNCFIWQTLVLDCSCHIFAWSLPSRSDDSCTWSRYVIRHLSVCQAQTSCRKPTDLDLSSEETFMDSQWASDKHPHANAPVATTSAFAWIASAKSRTQGKFAYSWVQRRSNRTQNPLLESKQFILSCHVPAKSSRPALGLTQYLGPCVRR